MLYHWEEAVTTAFLNMVHKADPDARVQILDRILAEWKGQTPLDPGASPDCLPIAGTITAAVKEEMTKPEPKPEDMKGRVSVIVKGPGGRIIADGMDLLTHPHERPEPVEDRVAMRRTKRLPLGEPL